MHPLRRLAPLFLVVGLVAWVGGWSASLVHQTTALHVECAEHGELMEAGYVASDGAGVLDDGATVATPGADDEHEHGCVFASPLLSTPAATPTVVALPVHHDHRDEQRVLVSAAPRGPPLAYAPKTSPPLV